MENNINRMPLIGDIAPSFKAVTTQGNINFPEDYKGKWVILFSHPADFTPVCTTEFMTFASMAEEFKAMNTELVGLSVDSLYAHIAWLRKIQELSWNGKEHGWNLAWLEEGSYYMDITWCDQHGEPGTRDWDSYFMVTEARLLEDHGVWTGGPATGTEDYSWH